MTTHNDNLCGCSQVAAIAAVSYRQRGFVVEVFESSGPATPCMGAVVSVPKLGHQELVLDDDADFHLAAEILESVRVRGWTAWAVVPLSRLGEAQAQLSGKVDCVQGWWEQGSDALRPIGFTNPALSR